MVAAALFLCLGLAAFAGVAPGEYWYALRHEGRTVGYSHVSVVGERGSGDLPLLRLSEETVLRLSDRGRQAERRYQGQFVLERESLAPLYARRAVVQDGLLEFYETRRQAERLEARATLAAVELEERHFSWRGDDVILDDLSPADWMILGASLVGLGEPRRLRAFVPRERERVSLALRPERERGLVAEIQGQTARLTLDARGDLLRLDAGDQGYSLVRAGSDVRLETDALEVLEGLVVASQLPVEALPRLSALTLRLSARVYGEELRPGDLLTAAQRFAGIVSSTEVAGEIHTTRFHYLGQGAPPLGAPVSEELLPLTRPEVGIESDHPLIVETARELAEGAGDSWEAAVRAGRWVHRNVGGDLLVQGSALTGQVVRQGASGTRAKLAAALCRALGIPARQAGGVLLAPPDYTRFVPHYWCEVHMGEAGWVPMDPVFDHYADLPPTYITFVRLGGIRRVDRLEVLEASFSEEAPMPFAPTSLAELSRVAETEYEFFVGQARIGVSRLRPLGPVEINGTPTAAFALETELDSRPAGRDYAIRSSARLYLDGAGRPVYYVYSEETGGRVAEATCEFGPEAGALSWRAGRESMEYGVARGPDSFILDRNMVGAWALLAARLPRAVGQTLALHAVVPCQPGELRATLRCRRTDRDGDRLCYLYEAEPIGETLWVDEDGGLARIENERLGLVIRRASTPRPGGES